jgi:tetratricopeptide (TPR) repeat protein
MSQTSAGNRPLAHGVVMAHLTEEELAGYAFDPDAVPNRQEIEAHVADCPQCSSSLTFIRSVDDGLADPDAWAMADPHEDGKREEMRERAAQTAAEDEEAAELLADLLGNPARTIWADLGSHERFRTAGVARRLIGAANDACEREPLEALTFADAAIDVAERVEHYSAPVLHDLRGTAWKERANALRLLGQYDAALEALKHAEHEFRKVPSAPLGPAIVSYVRGIVHYERGDLVKAQELLFESGETFASLGETDRYMRARHYMANVHVGQQDVPGAKAIYEQILAWAEATSDVKWIARESNTLGRCAYELRDLSAAVQYFHQSTQAFRALGLSSEAARPEWGLALVVLASGKPADALKRFRAVREQFHNRAMASDEALVVLDMMDALHALDQGPEIVTLASEVLQAFTEAGMLTSALTAFAYLKEASRRGAVKPRQVEYVRQFLGRLEREPALAFLPPDERYL